ncbi:unnamed protein product [marine sediment metagenome]|uniref:Uncharacterized protein n=1 Tax=marine sediment metagenome TaxID=412755 RepID=X1MMF7_9ZZZZ
MPYEEVAPALLNALSEIYPDKGKEKTIEWLNDYLREYEQQEQQETVKFVKKFIDELRRDITSSKPRHKPAPPDMAKKKETTPKPILGKVVPKVKIKDFRFKGQKIHVESKLKGMPGDNYFYYLATFNLNDNYVGHIHVKVYNNGERESFSCNDIFVIRELRDKG